MSRSTASAAREFQPGELGGLDRNANKASRTQLAKAAALIESVFKGRRCAWVGGYALNLRGSSRKTTDIDLIIAVDGVGTIRRLLKPHSWAIYGAFESTGSIQEKVFVDIGEGGQLVAVDIVLAGSLNTPPLEIADDAVDHISPAFTTPQGKKVPVLELAWQVETKLSAYHSRRKTSDFTDLMFLFEKYGKEVQEWSVHLEHKLRNEFFIVYQVEKKDKPNEVAKMKKILSLDRPGSPSGTGIRNSPPRRTPTPTGGATGGSPSRRPATPSGGATGGTPPPRPATPSGGATGGSPSRRPATPSGGATGGTPPPRPATPSGGATGGSPRPRPATPSGGSH